MKKQGFMHLVIYVLSIFLVLLTPISAYAANSDRYIDSASGRLQIGWVIDKRTIVLVDEPGLIKATFDSAWNYVRGEWSQRAGKFINELGKQDFVDLHLDLATTDSAELRVMPVDNGASLNYILHDNQVDVKLVRLWSEYTLSYEVHFDLAISITVKVDGAGRQIFIADMSVTPDIKQVHGLDIKSILVYWGAQVLIDSSVEEPL